MNLEDKRRQRPHRRQGQQDSRGRRQQAQSGVFHRQMRQICPRDAPSVRNRMHSRTRWKWLPTSAPAITRSPSPP